MNNIHETILKKAEEELKEAITNHLGEGWTFKDLEKRKTDRKEFSNGIDFYIDDICIFSFRTKFKCK